MDALAQPRNTGPDTDQLQAEADIRRRVGDMDLDFHAMAVVSNIYRAASAIRYHMEKTVLASHGLSWTAFTTLFVLWIWGEQESRHLAARTGVTKGTLTGVVRTLQKHGLCTRRQQEQDRRVVTVGLTPKGRRVIVKLFPEFNAQEVHVTSRLTTVEKDELAAALRTVITTLNGEPEGDINDPSPAA